MKIKAIILDIDGVIVGEKIGFNSPDPHAEVIARMRAIRDSGVKIILCTAKPHFAVNSIIESANLDNSHIADGGGVLISPIKNDILKKYVIDNDEAKRVIKACIENNIYVEAYTTEKYNIQKSQVCDITPKHTHILQCEPFIVDDLSSIDEQITKIMPVVSGEQEKAEFTQFFNTLGTSLTLSWGVHPVALPLQFGIITVKGISKKQGWIDILKNYGITPDETLGIGDSTSDWQFIETCKYAGAVKNASAELKELIKQKGKGNFIVGGPVDENGVLKIFDYFGLGKSACKIVVFGDLHYCHIKKLTEGVERKLTQLAEPLVEKLVEKVNQINPDVVINLGDTIQHDKDREMNIINFKRALSFFKKIKAPLCMIQGNHEVMGLDKEQFAKVLGCENLTFSVDINGFHFVLIDIEQITLITDENVHRHLRKAFAISQKDLNWLENDIKKNKLPSLYFVHSGVAEDTMKNNFWFEQTPAAAILHNHKALKKILETDKNIIAVFSGHQHWTKSIVEDGIKYFVCGSLTENINGKPDGVWLEIDLIDKALNIKEHHIDLDCYS